MQSGAQLLKDWVKRCRYTQVEAAGILGFHEAYMSMIVNGHRAPGRENAVKIERLTGIPVEAWTSTRVDESAERGRGKRRERVA